MMHGGNSHRMFTFSGPTTTCSDNDSTTSNEDTSNSYFPGLEYELHIEEEEEEELMNNRHEQDNHHHQVPPLETTTSQETTFIKSNNNSIWSFVGLILVGTANMMATKFQTIPMYNYPSILNVYIHLCFIPICFAYILPAYYCFKTIPHSDWQAPKLPFLIMGGLDSLAISMQVFCAFYLPGRLLVSLPQAAIPCSMIFSYLFLNERYEKIHYVGAGIVLFGVMIVLLMNHNNQQQEQDYVCQAVHLDQDCTVCQQETTQQDCLAHNNEINITSFSNSTDISNSTDMFSNSTLICQWLSFRDSKQETTITVWSFILILSCIPMTLSSIYKQIAVTKHADPMFCNGWVLIFQSCFAILFAVPAEYFATSTLPWQWPWQAWRGTLCLFAGRNVIRDGCHPDVDCRHSIMWLIVSVFLNTCFTLLIMFVLKYHDSSLLYLALTLTIPLAHVGFCFVDNESSKWSDIIGLCIILIGLACYRFGSTIIKPMQYYCKPTTIQQDTEEEEEEDFFCSSSANPADWPYSNPPLWETSLREPLMIRTGDI